MAKRILFIDRDGTLVKEAPPDYMVNDWSKLEFYPYAFKYMNSIATEFDYELAMVTNQDGLGTEIFPNEKFWPVHNFILRAFENEGVHFSAVYIDPSLKAAHSPNRKPRTGMVKQYMNNPEYDLLHSFVIGDRVTDVQFAKNLGCKALWLNNHHRLGAKETENTEEELRATVVALETTDWKDVYEFLKEQEK